ncbi:MAG: LPXTG cell wall anchor domain-containing protein [Bacteroides sp.]|nr:LPXTG cell wall anchor domain-containing protein [Bacteroides sp.]
MDFNHISYCLGVAITVMIPLLVYGARYLLPEDSERLEVIFYINCIIALLGIIATVNGRTATTGVNEVNINSLLAIIGITVIGSILGLLLFRKNQNKHNNQL